MSNTYWETITGLEERVNNMKIRLIVTLLTLLMAGCGKENNTSAQNVSVNNDVENTVSVDRQRLKVDSLQSIFYSTKGFLNVIDSFSQDDILNLYNTIETEYENNTFREVDLTEVELLRNSSKFTEPSIEGSIWRYFHYLTKYKYFDYSKYDEFKVRRVKAEHSDVLASLCNLCNLELNEYYEEIVFGTNRLSAYNFESNYFEVSTEQSDRQAVFLGAILDTEPQKEMWGPNKYYIAPAITNNPKRIRIYFEDSNTAEAFKLETKTLRLNYRLKDKIIPEYEYSDIESPYMFAWKQSARMEIKNESGEEGLNTFNDLSSESYAGLLKDYAIRTDKPIPIAYKNRKWYYGLVSEIVSIELQSKTLGTLQWRSVEWFLGLSIDDIITKERLAIERITNTEMNQFSKRLFDGAKLWDIYYLYFVNHNECQIPDGIYRDDFYSDDEKNVIFETYFRYFLEDIESSQNQLRRYPFATEELSEFNQQYLSGLDSLYEICETASSALESHKIASWKDFWQTDSPKSKAGSVERKAIINALAAGWGEINNKYFNPVETGFTKYVTETNGNQTGLILFDSKKAPIIRIIKKKEIKEPDYQKDTRLYDTRRGIVYKDSKKGSDFSIGDEIVAVNGNNVKTAGEYFDQIGKISKGSIATLSVKKRDSAPKDIRIKIY